MNAEEPARAHLGVLAVIGVVNCCALPVLVGIAAAFGIGVVPCVVVNERGIVLGRLRLEGVDQDSEALVEDLMEPGPATVRADADVSETLERLRARRIPHIIVSTPDGELLGVLRAKRP